MTIMFNITRVSLDQGLLTTARGPNPDHEDISSGSRRHFIRLKKTFHPAHEDTSFGSRRYFVNNEKIIYL